MVFGQFIEYRGHTGSIEYSAEDQIYFGQLLNIKDMICYDGSSVEELYEHYRQAADDYLALRNQS